MGQAPKVDPEFGALLPPLTDGQRAGLESDILACSVGIICPLAVWKETGILLDGHHRLDIATRHGLPYGRREISLPSREAAIEWIFANQRDRRNLTPGQLALVMGRHYNRTKQGHGGQARGRCSGKSNTVERTSKRLGEMYGVNPCTVIGHGKFAAAIETLRAVDPGIEAKVIAGEGPTQKVAIAAAAKAGSAPDEARALLRGEVEQAPTPRAEYVPPRTKRGRPCDGMRIAKTAAGKMNEIREDDTERAAAFSYMRRWLDAHEA